MSDSAIRHALAELAEGETAARLTMNVLQVVEQTSQVRWTRWIPRIDRRLTLIMAAALLLLTVAALGAGRPADPIPLPGGPFVLVLERWNGLVDPDSVVSHTAFDPAGGPGVPLEVIPRNAIDPRWSKDGSAVLYSAVDAAIRAGLGGPAPRLRATELYVSDGDGPDPRLVPLPLPLDDYWIGGPGPGLPWAPAGDRFALSRNGGTCGGPDCLPPGSITVFDRSGVLVTTIPVPQGDLGLVGWSPDGRSLGWYTGACPGGACVADAFRWRAVDGGAETVIQIPGIADVRWLDEDRLLAAASVRRGARERLVIERIFSMRSDGTEVREARWAGEALPEAAMSPLGTALASLDSETGTLRIDDLVSGARVEVSVPPHHDLLGWSPDGRWLLFGMQGTSDGRGTSVFSTTRANGENFTRIGEGERYAWAPAGVVPSR